ncbi:MAG: UDP-3-O-(3-hydroxymyristoyl)glucosamine N-acyltransferase [Deltaproteobacteria bacterium]|nr:MAG: UDP-3-O-(3-hydroxymyristoyl)glucosamine N-acyltransferase [Deltaproteobacteria bacterium]
MALQPSKLREDRLPPASRRHRHHPVRGLQEGAGRGGFRRADPPRAGVVAGRRRRGAGRRPGPGRLRAQDQPVPRHPGRQGLPHRPQGARAGLPPRSPPPVGAQPSPAGHPAPASPLGAGDPPLLRQPRLRAVRLADLHPQRLRGDLDPVRDRVLRSPGLPHPVGAALPGGRRHGLRPDLLLRTDLPGREERDPPPPDRVLDGRARDRLRRPRRHHGHRRGLPGGDRRLRRGQGTSPPRDPRAGRLAPGEHRQALPPHHLRRSLRPARRAGRAGRARGRLRVPPRDPPHPGVRPAGDGPPVPDGGEGLLHEGGPGQPRPGARGGRAGARGVRRDHRRGGPRRRSRRAHPQDRRAPPAPGVLRVVPGPAALRDRSPRRLRDGAGAIRGLDLRDPPHPRDDPLPAHHRPAHAVTAAELARLVGGTLHGADRSVSGVGPLEGAGPHEVAYATGQVPDDCRAGVLLVRQPVPGRSCVVVDHPKLAFIRLLRHLFPETDGLVERPRGGRDSDDGPATWVDAKVHPTACVHPTARLSAGVVVHAGAWVGAGCVVGADSVLFPHVVLYPGTEVGRRCRIHAGAVLGADGFSYEPGADGLVKVPQVGRVIVGDDVEIGPNTVVDRAFLEATEIGDGSKLDALVMVGHNCRIGRHAVLAGQAGLAGSVTIGDGAVLAGQAGIVDHRRVGAGARVGAQAGVHRDVPPGESVLGSPAMPVRLAMRVMAVLPRLPEVVARVRRLERQE